MVYISHIAEPHTMKGKKTRIQGDIPCGKTVMMDLENKEKNKRI